MKTYKEGDIITLRSRKYLVQRDTSSYPWNRCGKCAFDKGIHCTLRRHFSAFLKDCNQAYSLYYFQRYDGTKS